MFSNNTPKLLNLVLYNKLTKKHFKKIRPRYSRALSNVVTSAILLASVSIMGVMMLGWSQTNIAEQKIELNEIFDTQVNKINENLFFENIWFAAPAGIMTQNHLNVTLTNVGILGLNVTSIRITNVTGTNSTALPAYSYVDGGIKKSDSLSLNVTYPWVTGDELDILVFSGRGNQFITQVVAP